MFKSKTTFVVGAGASEEAGLPIGSGLTQKIAGLLQLQVNDQGRYAGSDVAIYRAIVQLAKSGPPWDKNRLYGSGRAIAEAMQLAPSIDTFLETHASNQEYVMLGKLGIAHAIATEERKSKLASKKQHQPFEVAAVKGTWYQSLAQQLFTGTSVKEPEAAFGGVSFVVFNYDRCLQRFLVRAVEVYYRLSTAEAHELVSQVPITHAYGTLGSIFPHEPDHASFGGEDIDLIAAANRIKTFSESVETATSQRIQDQIRNAETLIFLGFGFHDQNMDLLNPSLEAPLDGTPQHRVFSTTKGFSQSDEQVVRDQISIMLTGAPEDIPGQWIHTNNGTCSDLFATYWRSLTDAARLNFNDVL